jgi:hypothetical protein
MTQLQLNESNNTEPEGLCSRWTRPAAGITGGVAALAVVAMTWIALTHPLAGGLVATASIWFVLAMVSIVSAYYLWQGRPWAQQALLGLWAAVVIGAVAYLLMGIVFADATWWADHPAGRTVGIPLAGIALLAGTVAIGMLVASTPKNTRSRYGAMVAAVVTAAFALAITINVIAQRDYVRKSFESFGLYKLSPRSRQIIDKLDADTPIRLTSLYNDTTKQNAAYGQRTFELLDEMATHGQRERKSIQAINANSTADRTRAVARLKARFSSEAAPQIALLRECANRSKVIVDELNAEAARWEALPDESYLNLWNTSASTAPQMLYTAEQTETLRRELSRQLAPDVGIHEQASTLPNYGQLMAGTTDFLKQTRRAITDLAGRLREYQTIPEAINQRRDGVNADIQRLAGAQADLLEIVGAPDDPTPSDIRATYRDFIDQAGNVSQYTELLATRLDTLAEPELMVLIKRSRPWFRESESLDGTVARNDLPGLLRQNADRYNAMAYQLESLLPTAQDDYLVNRVSLLRQQTMLLASILTSLTGATQETLDALSTVDPASQALFEQAQSGRWMQGSIAVIDSILDQAESLPMLQDDTVLPELAQDNIVLIEIGDDELRVIPFDAMWPIASGGYASTANGDGPRRVFNGNAAIGSTLVRMTEPPLATVVVVFYASTDNMQSQIDPRALFQVYGMLGASNFRLRLWNLAEDSTPNLSQDLQGRTVDSTGTPVVLLILPPPQPSIGGVNMNESHRDKVTKLIDEGTPSIFLTSYLWPETIRIPGREPTLAPTLYRWDDYLQRDWGIDAQTDKLLLPVLPDTESPGRFFIDYRKLNHLPLSLFSDHAIGKPLTGQRMLWTYTCPVLPADHAPSNVDVAPLLSVPGQWSKSLWITNRGREMIEEAIYTPQTTTFAPDLGSHEQSFPSSGVPVAVAAERKTNSRVDRVVVLGVGKGLTDRHLSIPPKHTDEQGREITESLPRGNIDLLINSLYWVLDQDSYIASGPAIAKPIGDLSRATRSTLWVICVLLLPAGMLALGAVVMILRRR